jgi:hypothetical protein
MVSRGRHHLGQQRSPWLAINNNRAFPDWKEHRE